MTDSKTIWSYAAYAGLILGLVSAAYYTCDWAIGKFCTEGALIYLGVAAKIALWITKFVVCIVLMKFAMQRFVNDVNDLPGTGNGSRGNNARTDGNGSNPDSNCYYGTTGNNARTDGNGSNPDSNGYYGTTGNNARTDGNGSNPDSNCYYGTTGNSGNHGITNSDTFRLGAAIAVLSALIYSGFLLAFVLYIQPDIFKNTLDSLRESPMLTEAAIEAAEAIAPKFPAITFFSNFIYCTLFGTILSVILSRNIPSTNPFKN